MKPYSCAPVVCDESQDDNGIMVALSHLSFYFVLASAVALFGSGQQHAVNPFSEACKNCTKGRVLGQRDTPVCEKMLVQNTRAPILLVSTFVNNNHKHMAEVLCALAENIMSPSLQKVHALHEGSPETLIAAILDASAHYPGSNLEYEVCLPFVLSAKLVVVSTKKQASYPEMIYYACTKLGGERVLLSNTDVVFDSSLDRLERDRISFLDRQTVYVFSVTAPRADAGPYLERFNNSGWPARCAPLTRCHLNETKIPRPGNVRLALRTAQRPAHIPAFREHSDRRQRLVRAELSRIQ